MLNKKNYRALPWTLFTFSCLGLLSVPAIAQQLTPEQQRITDQQIQADQQAYQQVQARIHALNETGARPVIDYHLSKAQCWLDVSFHEYTRNDRSDFTQLSLDESVKLVQGMEQKVSPLPMDTPLVNGAAKIRPDLWEKFTQLKQHPGFSCAQQWVACAEVELVHAGNEYNQQQWRHAKPYVQIAEDNMQRASLAAEQCPVTPVIAKTPPLPNFVSATVTFEFDKYSETDVRSYQELRDLLTRSSQDGHKIREVVLIGHADRMAGRGSAYNQMLSERRADTIRVWLEQQGVRSELIHYSFRGDSKQIKACEGVQPRKALLECLLPNRRVEVRLELEP